VKQYIRDPELCTLSEPDCELSNVPFAILPLVITKASDENFHSHEDEPNWLSTVLEEEMKKMQRNDPIIGPFIDYISESG
jgi:hypothetical protein